MNLSNATNAAIGDNQGIGTINNDDPLPSVSISGDPFVMEGNSGTTPAVFTVGLSNPSDQTITVHFATSDGTAVSTSDYVTTSGTVTLLPGQTSQPVNTTVNGDPNRLKPDETFFVNLSNPAERGDR